MGERRIFIDDKPGYGGGSTCLISLANDLCKSGYEIMLIAAKKQACSIHSEILKYCRADYQLATGSERSSYAGTECTLRSDTLLPTGRHHQKIHSTPDRVGKLRLQEPNKQKHP